MPPHAFGNEIVVSSSLLMLSDERGRQRVGGGVGNGVKFGDLVGRGGVVGIAEVVLAVTMRISPLK